MNHALAFSVSGGVIDAALGIIRGVSVATVGPARGHGVHCDDKMLRQVQDCASTYPGGLKVEMSHGGGIAEIIGSLKGFRIDGQQLRADLYLLSNYPKRDYVLELAEKMSESFGLSIKFSGPTEEIGGLSFARCVEIYSCDLVSEPAANPNGLFSAVDAARGKETAQPMTPAEIQAAVALALTAALDPITKRLDAFEAKITAPNTELAALKQQVAEFNTKLADDAGRIALAAKAVASEFAARTGTASVKVDGNGAAGAGGAGEKPDVTQAFDAVLTKHFNATQSKTRAWQLATKEDPKGYTAFLASGKRPSIDGKK